MFFVIMGVLYQNPAAIINRILRFCLARGRSLFLLKQTGQISGVEAESDTGAVDELDAPATITVSAFDVGKDVATVLLRRKMEAT
jgi:hypothetical protein